ncbi:S8 family serine peptidase [Nostoc sp.]|uniref:S8 family serine peptidase n=1 Tax=Nostoc sp. TaxID=1180 RepID=UPI002FFA07FA
MLGSETSGHPQVCIAVLDGLVDLKHPCFQGADLSVLPTLVTGQAKSDGQMSLHGTHVASVIFGQPSSPVIGIAPACKGLIVPVFHDDRLNLSQLDLARAIALFIRLNVCCLVILNIKTGKS